MHRFARLGTALVAIGGAMLFPLFCAAAENAEAWRMVPRIRGEVDVEYHSWVDEESSDGVRTTVDSLETGGVRFVLVLERTPEPALPPGVPPEMAAAMRAMMPAPEPNSLLSWRAESAVITGTYRLKSAVTNYGSTTGQADFTGEPAYLKDFIFELTPATGVWQILSPGILRERYQQTYVHTGDDPHTSYGTHNAVVSEVFNGTVTGKPGTISTVQRDSGQIDQKPTRGFTKVAQLRLWPEVEDVEVEVTIKDYEKWRPKGSIANPTTAGNHLVARATLVPKEGEEAKALPKVKNFSFELVGTSREPGICLNWPLNAKDTDFDLRLAAAPGFAPQLSEKDQKNEITQTLTDPKGQPYAESQIDSFDFGGRAFLRVVCQLADGREIVGLIKEGDRRDYARLPKRDDSDWIAESWREQMKIGKLSAQSDDDNEPVGDGTKGDGLTLYEEYRGWVENGVHIEGDPLTKDFFVQMEKAGVALLGIGKFQRITGLNVHYQFKDAEFPASRIMNANRDSGPHVTDQHGVIVQVMKNQPGVSRAAGGPGNPKMITSVDLMSDIADYGANYTASTVAHELGHSVNLWHHGDDDSKVVWAVVNGKLYEGGRNNSVREILVRNEEGDDCTDVIIEEALAIQALPAPGNRLKYQMGVDQGQHSGDDNCVMRYDDAQTFIYRTLTQYRFINFNEPVGKELCTSAEGTGVNDKDRTTMQSRYGPAQASRGDCLHQILVNDAGNAPRRH
jgi:hypothetical protein